MDFESCLSKLSVVSTTATISSVWRISAVVAKLAKHTSS